MSADKLKLLLDQSVITYTGLFEDPAFSFWKKNKLEIIEGIYKVFINYNVALSDISVYRDDEDIAEEAITINIDNLGEYKLTISGVECTASESSFDNYKLFLEMLQRADSWLRHFTPNLKYQIHIFEMGGHGHFQGGTTAQYYLQHYAGSRKQLKSIKQDALLANGLIFNWVDALTGGRCRLEVDESLDIANGLFIRWLQMMWPDNAPQIKDHFSFEHIGMHSLNVMKEVLGELYLEVEDNL